MKFFNFLKYYRESFGAKIFFLLTVFTVIIYVSFTAFFIYHQSKTLKKNLINEGNRLVSLLAYSSRLGVFAENEDLLRDPVEGILQDKEVTLVQVFTADGRELKMLGRHEKETFGKSAEENLKRQKKTFAMLRESKSTFYYAEDGQIEFWAPVISSRGYTGEEALFFRESLSLKKDNIIGFVKIIFTTELLNKSIRDVLLKSIFIPIFFIIPGWFVIYFIVKEITKPLNRLTEGVKAIGAGGSVEKIPVETMDETGKLALAFNNMA